MGQKEESMFKEKNIINDNKGGIGAIIIVFIIAIISTVMSIKILGRGDWTGAFALFIFVFLLFLCFVLYVPFFLDEPE